MTDPDLVEAIEQLAESSPESLLVLLTMGCNELWGAIDEGRADMTLLVQLRDHVQALVYQGPASQRQ
jgi:hypothetical protein